MPNKEPSSLAAPHSEILLHVKPQINLSRSTAARMWLVFCCAFMAVVQSSIGDSGVSVAVAITALVSAFLAELVMTYPTHGFGKLKDGSAAASALVLVLLLPNNILPIYAAFGSAFAMIVIKHSFGGLGSNWMNPALGGWLFIRFSWPFVFAAEPDRTAENIFLTGSNAAQLVGDFFNNNILSLFGSVMPPGYIDLFTSKSPGIIADRAGLALVIGIIIIAAFRISRFWLSLLYLAVFGFLVRMFGDVPSGGNWWNGDVIFAFLSGGTLAAAFILIADPSSGAKSIQGNIVLVVLAAILGFLFRYFGNELYGCFFAVIFINILTPLAYRIERCLFYGGSI
ncbi:MAG: RnfABCDGE type electron transport complex subunit D [Treponema sp.]|nr:RnfABCDGE type electron transport complex subunit D [Treponema sp.]